MPFLIYLKNFFKIFFIFYFGVVGSLLLCRLSIVVVSEGYTPVAVHRRSLKWLLLFWSTGSRVHGLRYLQHMGSIVATSGFYSTGSIVVVHGLSCSTVFGIFLDQKLSPCHLHQQEDFLWLSHQGSPKNFLKIREA